MANFMPVMVFMEQRGGGWMIVRKEMRAFNRPAPELMQDERNEFVEVTVRLGPTDSATPTWLRCPLR